MATWCVDIETDTDWKRANWYDDSYGLSYEASILCACFYCLETGEQFIFTDFPTNREATDLDSITDKVKILKEFIHENIQKLQSILNNSSLIIAHNAVFDLRQLAGKYNGGDIGCPVYDTMVMARLIHPQKQAQHSLLVVAQALGIELDNSYKEMKNQRSKLHLMPIEEVIAYCMQDVLLTAKVYEEQAKLVTTETLTNLVIIECDAMREYCIMSAKGIRLNMNYINSQIDRLQALQTKKTIMNDGLSNPDSPMQRVEYIYLVKQIPIPDYQHLSEFYTTKTRNAIQVALNVYKVITIVIKHGDTLLKRQELQGTGEGFYTLELTLKSLSSSAKVIDKLLESVGSDNLDILGDHLKVSKMLTTLIHLKYHARFDGKLHPVVTIDTDTGRRSAKLPQVQNWRMQSLEDDPAQDLSGCVLGDSAHSTVFEIDYSNAEIAMSALLAGDSVMSEAYQSSDFHSVMAKVYFGEKFAKLEKKSPEWKQLRHIGKTLTFGSAYGMGFKALAAKLGISLEDSRQFLINKDLHFPATTEAKKQVQESILNRYSKEGFGYIYLWSKRIVPVDVDKSYKGWNYACQGGVAEIVKRAIIECSNTFRNNNMLSRVMMDMHDAIIFSIDHGEWNKALTIIQNIMENVIPAHLNNRTNPPIKWFAEPDVESNKVKWGKLQEHFEYVPEIALNKVTVASENENRSTDTGNLIQEPKIKDSVKVTEIKQRIQEIQNLLSAEKITRYPMNAQKEWYIGIDSIPSDPYTTDYKGWILASDAWLDAVIMDYYDPTKLGFKNLAHMIEVIGKRNAEYQALNNELNRLLNELSK